MKFTYVITLPPCQTNRDYLVCLLFNFTVKASPEFGKKIKYLGCVCGGGEVCKHLSNTRNKISTFGDYTHTHARTPQKAKRQVNALRSEEKLKRWGWGGGG